MPILAFSKSSDPGTPDDARISSVAVRYVEPTRQGQPGKTVVHMLGQGENGITVMEAIDVVAGSIAGLVAAPRHYAAGQPDDGRSTVFIAPANVSHLRPNNPTKRDFWSVFFVDGTELRIIDPLPVGL